MRNLAVLFVALALTGCNPAYQRPAFAPGGAASVRFIAAQPKGYSSAFNVYAHDGDDCGGAPKKVVGMGGGFLNFGGGAKKGGDLGMTKDPAVTYQIGQYFETTVNAGTRFHFTAAGGENNGVCYVSGSFIPQVGAEYEMTYSTDRAYCYVRVEKISLQGSTFVREREPSNTQRPTACTFFWN